MADNPEKLNPHPTTSGRSVRNMNWGPRLVGKKAKMTGTAPRRESKHIERGGYIAEIMVSDSALLGVTIYHYVIQRKGWLDIVHWGQELSMQRAQECVNDFIDGRISKQA